MKAFQNKSLFTHTDVCIYIIEKNTSFFRVLFSEIAEHFGLPLLDRKHSQDRMEHFSQKLSLPSVTASLRRCQQPAVGAAGPARCALTLPLLSRFTPSRHHLLPAFPGASVAAGPDAGAWRGSSGAPGGACLLHRRLLRLCPSGQQGKGLLPDGEGLCRGRVHAPGRRGPGTGLP